MTTTSQTIVDASSPREAIRKALAGAKPVSAEITSPGGRGAYDMAHDPEIMVQWDNGIITVHRDVFCGQDSMEGGCYRPHVRAVGVRYRDRGFLGDDVECRLWAFGPREQKRFEAAIALAFQDESAD